MVMGMGSVEPPYGCTTFSRYVWFPTKLHVTPVTPLRPSPSRGCDGLERKGGIAKKAKQNFRHRLKLGVPFPKIDAGEGRGVLTFEPLPRQPSFGPPFPANKNTPQNGFRRDRRATPGLLRERRGRPRASGGDLHHRRPI